MNGNEKKLIIVLGMHRSGTSAITRALQVLGVSLGDNLMPPIAGINDKGFFEDLDINHLNMDILNFIDSDWFLASPISYQQLDMLLNSSFFLNAVTLLREKIEGTKAFAFKDPRVSKLLPFWNRVFKHLELKPNYLIACRHPLSVVKSLAKRDGFNATHSYLLWLAHLLESIQSTKGKNRLLVDYDRLMASPKTEILRIQRAFELPIDAEAFAEYELSFLDNGLRHSVCDRNDLLLDPECPDLVRDIFEELQKFTLEDSNLNDPSLDEKLDRWINELDRMVKVINLIDVQLLKIRSLNQAVTERDGQITSLSQTVTERDGQIASLSQTLTERDGQITSLSQTVTERDGQIANLSQAVTERDGQIASLSQTLTERDGQITSLSQTVTERDGQIANLSQAVTERDGQIASLSQAVTERDGQITSLSQTVTERDGQIASLTDETVRRGKWALGLDAELRDTRAKLTAVTSSNSWRLTLPLREARRWVSSPAQQTKRYTKATLGILKRVYQSLPLSYQTKAKHRQMLAKHFPRLLLATGAPMVTIPVFAVSHASPQQVSLANSSEVATDVANSEAHQVANNPVPSDPVANMPISSAQGNAEGEKTYRILLVSYYYPTRSHAGGLRILDIYTLIKQRCRGVQLDLLTHRRPSIDGSIVDSQHIFDNIYLSSTEDLSPSCLKGLEDIQYDVVDLQFHQAAYHLEEYRRIASKIIFTPMESLVKVLYLEMRSQIKTLHRISIKGLLAQFKTAYEEILFCRNADYVVCVSRTDAAFIRAVGGGRKVRAIETGISPLEFSEVWTEEFTRKPASMHLRKIIYVAYFGSQTNIDALMWYLQEVHPRIAKAVPDYKLMVVGRGDLSSFEPYRGPQVELVGEVPTIAPYIKSAKLGIAPALGGSGLRGKINQYAVLGIPAVVSPIALQGLAYRDGESVFVANDPQEFADRCICLLTDDQLNERIAHEARKLCINKYSWESKWPKICAAYGLKEHVAC